MSQHPEDPAATVSTPTSAPTEATDLPAGTTGEAETAPEITPVLTPSQAKRANQTLKGMIISVVLTVAVALPIIFINPASKAETYRQPVDISAVASQAAADAVFTPWAPALPEGDYVNFARWLTGNIDGIKYWEFGVVTHDDKFVWVRQTGDVNPSWLATVTDNAVPAGEHLVDGVAWELRKKDKSQVLLSTIGTSTIVLSSESGIETLEALARLATAQVQGS
ncbi:hypothetical protein CQ018_13835 [Arthrobacter sp. MYb227]|uniref:DUF4245 domain-containing protein n=1 Tax=Arthrobacter sp. MYb227 TaxID=1848601 RepID=UPI000D43ACB8|nr:DUF4245 domain-containing protein [Arthrobacter sp. MYb227]PQZ91046.1 hypothetical protein CQ018_13835 [Arthrobacter sp. MYb227]